MDDSDEVARARAAEAIVQARKAGQRVVIDAGSRQYRLFVVAGEHSGDLIGGKLMAELNRRLEGRVRYLGVGGEDMERQGLVSQFPLADVAVMGPLSILPRLPRLVRRVYRTVAAAVAAQPDAVIIIDSPEFTHPIAKRIRKRLPHIPIIDYVSPTVWAWRPGRARKMARYVDHVLALLPFEPEAHARLGGPPCTYVGHPMVERQAWLDTLDTQGFASRLGLGRDGRQVLVVLPGSRASEVSRLMDPFGGAVRHLVERGQQLDVIIPAVRSVRALIEAKLAGWPVVPHLVEGEEDKFRAFKLAHCALAASGTVTLELAMAGTPMVVAYRVDGLAANLRFLVKVPSVVLANLVLGEKAFPELLQEDCRPERLADALELLLKDTPERSAQLQALARIPERMWQAGPSPSAAAADVVIAQLDAVRALRPR
ncbi:MAG: lipid-A-disaccharide synthase [Hyphomicrobiaceae bacterium]|nr:lipid-A-disaccharide synthase [Hyphomicrobiaceae bacterium]